jgi:hypothetical protein
MKRIALAMARRRVSTAALILVAAAMLVGFALRAASVDTHRHSYYAAGITAWEATTALSVDRGDGFSINQRELTDLIRLQNTRNKLVDPSTVRLRKGTVSRPQVLEMPGLAIVLAALWKVGPQTYGAVLWIQAGLDSVAILLVWWIGWRLSRRQMIGVIAAWLYALSGEAVRLASAPLLDSWAMFLTVYVVAAFVWARERPTTGRLLLAGSLIGVGIYFRPFMLLLAPGLALVLLRSVRGFLIPLLVALALAAPWTVRNAIVFHSFIPTRTDFGQTLWEGLGQRTNSYGAVANDGATAAMVHRARPNLEYGTPAFDNYLLAKALKAIRDHPGGYLALVASRLVWLWPCLFALVYPLRKTRLKAVALIVAMAMIAPYIPIFTGERYSAPALFAYYLLVACAVAATSDALLSVMRRKRPEYHTP